MGNSMHDRGCQIRHHTDITITPQNKEGGRLGGQRQAAVAAVSHSSHFDSSFGFGQSLQVWSYT